MELKLTNEIIAKLTGAPVAALDKGISQQANKSSDNEIYIEGIIERSGSWFDGMRGFITPEGLRDSLNKTKTDQDINLYIDSPGGSVFGAANMVSQIIKKRKEGQQVNVTITGLCASAATYFLFEADNTAIAKSGTIMVHRSMACVCGNYKDMEQVVEVIKEFDTQYIKQVMELTGKTMADVESAVDKETWFTADSAIDFGLVQKLYTAAKPKNGAKQQANFRMLLDQLSDYN